MSILKTLDQYNPNNLYFCDTIKNNVMPNGNFIRILYCMFNFTMNGVYLHIEQEKILKSIILNLKKKPIVKFLMILEQLKAL